MAVFERSTLVDAPLDEVWQFHSTVDGLVALTPSWLNLTVESVVDPDGEPDPDRLEAGSELRVAIRPLGVGPQQRWTSRITRREREDRTAEFHDEMVSGPFRRWHHIHRFAATPDGTRVTDRVEYQLPLGPARGLSIVAWPGFEAMFGYRHRQTKQLLE